MKIKYTLLVIVLIAAVIYCRGTADSEEGVGDAKKETLSVIGNDDSVRGAADPTKTGNAVSLENNNSREQLDPKEKETEVKKGNVGGQRDEKKDNEGSSSEPKKEFKMGRLPPVREKCDSSSKPCTDDDKTLVACLIVPGNESPALTLLILNKGKGTKSIKISAPDSVQLERNQIELQENKDIEVKVRMRGVVDGDSIVLTAGDERGSCTLVLKDEAMGTKIDHHNPSSKSFSIYQLTPSRGAVFLGGLVIAGVSVFLCRRSGMKLLSRKGPKYQRLDMELPVSHGSTTEGGGNEGWDNSWGDSWDDEEASAAPALPLTPTLSSRKFKEGWKD